MIDSGAAVTQVDASLRRIARVSGLEDAAIVVLPTALFVSVPGDEDVQTSVESAGSSLRLDQIDAVFQVVDAAERGEIDAEVALARLAAARTSPPPFRPQLHLLGFPLLAAGLALILHAGPLDLLVASVLGVAVGALQLYGSRIPEAYALFLPVVSAFAVTLAVFLLARAGLDIDPYTPVIAALVTFLPGALLTTAVIELATGQMMSGAGRLAQGVTRLVLLAIGIIAAGQLVGVPATTAGGLSTPILRTIVPWLGVAIFGVGVVLAYSARPSSLRWIVLILYVAYAGQLLGGLLLGSQLSAFAGAFLMTPVAMLAARQRSGPPTLVTFLPAFWLLVPGAISLAGVTAYLGEDRVEGTTSLVSAGSTMIAITFGVLLGLAAGSFAGLSSSVSLTVTGQPADRRPGV